MSRVLGRYELVEPLGQGGMGEVWLARISGAGGFQKACIVKTVLPALVNDRQFVERFQHEGRVLVHLSHSNIAQVYDMGEAEGALFMALEYVAGVDASRLVAQLAAGSEVMPVGVALFIAWQAAEGLAYAHRKTAPDGSELAIVHRDVSPQNVMISYEGEVKVIDFGIARSAARSHSTQANAVLGKLGYMSPEQALAEAVDARADQYSLAVTLWEFLAGKPYARGSTAAETMAAMSNPKRQPLGPLRSEVDATLEAVVQRALSPRPSDRYPTTDDFGRALLSELTRLGGPPSKRQVGEWVKLKCPEAFASNQELLSRISTLGVAAEQPVTAVKVGPIQLTTDAAVATFKPNRGPWVIVATLLVLGSAAGFGVWSMNKSKGEGDKVPPPFVAEAAPSGTKPETDSSRAKSREGDNVPLPAAADSKDAGADADSSRGKSREADNVPLPVAADSGSRPPSDAASNKPPDIGLNWKDTVPPPAAKNHVRAEIAVVISPVRLLRVKNTSLFPLVHCRVTIPGRRSLELKLLNIGFERELLLSSFVSDPSADNLENEVRLHCAEGTITVPVPSQ